MGIQDELDAFQTMKTDLEAKYMGRWVLVYQRRLVAVFDSFEQAAAEAVNKFGVGPYLIRQVGAAPPRLPVSVMFHAPHAHR